MRASSVHPEIATAVLKLEKACSRAHYIDLVVRDPPENLVSDLN